MRSRETTPVTVLPLALDSPKWARLEDTFGTAERVPSLLAALADGNGAAIDGLFDRICHQMSVYSSSIAAFPHLITAAATLGTHPGLQVETLCLAGAICQSHAFDDMLQRSDHAQALAESLPAARVLAEAALAKTADRPEAIYLLMAVAAFDHRPVLARVLEGFADEEFTCACPGCSAELYVWPCDEGLFVAADDPVVKPKAVRTLVTPRQEAQAGSGDDRAWLEAQCGRNACLAKVQGTLPYLFGAAACPRCAQAFPLYDALADRER